MILTIIHFKKRIVKLNCRNKFKKTKNKTNVYHYFKKLTYNLNKTMLDIVVAHFIKTIDLALLNIVIDELSKKLS